jgi:hypothetical protein
MKPRLRPLQGGLWRARSTCGKFEIVTNAPGSAYVGLMQIIRAHRIRIGYL